MKRKTRKKNRWYACLIGLLLVNIGTLSAQPIAVQFPQQTLTARMNSIIKNSKSNIVFDEQQLESIKVEALSAETKSTEELLASSLLNTKFTYKKMQDGSYAIFEKDKKMAYKKVMGQVVDADGSAIIGATVMAKDEKALGTVTDLQGHFELNIPQTVQQLLVSYIGYISQSTKVTNEPIKVTLKQAAQTLNEVVVVGYGTQKKLNLTGAVSQVSSEVFENRPAANLTRALQGTVPNLNIKMVDGSPTRSATYNVRGVTSIGAGGSALVLIDGVEGDPAMVNPNDVESVSVLKDASSAAIYGSRAAFGVVLITTKKVKKDRVKVDVSSSFSMNQRTVTPKLVTNGYEWAKNFDEAFSGWNDYKSHATKVNNIFNFSLDYLDRLKEHNEDPSLGDVVYNEEKKYYEYFGNTDWYNLMMKDNIPATEQTISVSGGSERVNYYISGRYYFQDGIFRMNPDKFNKYNLRAKGDIKINKWLTVENNFDYSTYNYKFPLLADRDIPIWRLLELEGFPMAVPRNPDGSYTHIANYVGYASFSEKSNESVTDRTVMRNTVGLIAEPIKDVLTFKADFTYAKTSTLENIKNNYTYYSSAKDVSNQFGNSQLRQNSTDITYYSSNITGEFKKTFNQDHDFKALLGGNIETSSTRTVSNQRDGLLVPDKPDFNLMDGINYSITGGGNEWAFLGAFYRLSYAYKSKYLAEVNGRYDGSSKFPKEEQFGFFPSFSAGWRISEEAFMKGTRSWLDNLKVRASYGSLGNGNVSPYRFMETMSVTKSSVIINGIQPSYTSMPGVIPDGLTWEKSTIFDLGLDANLFNSRLNLVFDWYNRRTTDMFTNGPTLPATLGASMPKGNYADMETKGWELSLSWNDAFHLGNSLFRYGISASMWDNRSTITRFNNERKDLSSIYYEGCEVGEIWGYITEGLFTSEEEIKGHANQDYVKSSTGKLLLPGDIKFADLDDNDKINDGDNTVNNPGDRRIIGNSSPRYQYSFNLNASWKGFGVSAFFQGIGKRDWYFDKEAALFWGPYNRPYSFQPVKMMADHWTEENTDAYFPRLRTYNTNVTTNALGAPQTRYLQDASYLRLKSLTIDYTLPQQWIKHTKIQQAKIFFTGQNLFTWSALFKHSDNFDPEVIEDSVGDITNGGGQGYAYPMLKTYTIGFNLSF